jgi:mRNA interferase MazF
LLVQPDVANLLKKPSLIKTHKIATLETELIIGKIGAINKDQIHELNLKLKRILGL